jgi:tRNA (guanine-N7-)-methyltransferase
MRLRTKPWANDWIADHDDLVFNSQRAIELKGKWGKVFVRPQPIYLEIGTGKGLWIFEMAKKYPNLNFVGLEIQETAVAIAARLSFESAGKIPNLRYIYGDGAGIENYFQKGELSKIFLNHSDPWPKARHEKRRLTYRSFLSSYQQTLPVGGELEFKTDNQELFAYSLESFKNFKMSWEADEISYDLHRELYKNPENVQTEYEKKWSQKGQPEFWIRARFQ